MTEYKIKKSTKILMIFLGIFFTSLIVYLIRLIPTLPLFMKFGFLFVDIFILFAIYSTFVHEIRMDEDKLEYVHFGLPIKKDVITWNSVKEVDSYYFLNSDGPGVIILIPKNLTKENGPISIKITEFPIDTLKEIICRLPSDVNVKLYSHLKRKLQGKQTLFYRETS